MTILTDGDRTVRISIRNWSDGTNGDMIGYGEDCSGDFFDIGNLERSYSDVMEAPVYWVDDVQYAIDQANDMASGTGDYDSSTAGIRDSDWKPTVIIDVEDL